MSFNTHKKIREYAGGSSVGGILRKGAAAIAVNAGEARQVDLLVFGYACKVFRDDAKARDIDQGKHLIPWMGDSSLKIDRYDVRGALYELTPHEPPAGGYGNRLDYLSADEQRAEQLCEEERYLYLHNNEEELILQQEEDFKRATQSAGAYNQVEFQYGNDAESEPIGPKRENSPSCEEESDQAFTLPRNFVVPASIQLPETMKQHAIIEKTARFIATQGVQMEILLKAKQSNNVQFEFLTQNSTLNPYYKFVVNAIKDGIYPAESQTQQPSNEPPAVAATIGDTICNSTLTTSTSTSTNTKAVITVPTIKYKPSANCAYTQLISKIKGVPLPSFLDDNATSTAGINSSTSAANSPASTGSNGSNFTPVLLQYNGNTFVTEADADANSNSNSNSNLNANAAQPQVEVLKNTSAFALAQDYCSDSESETEVENVVEKPAPPLNFPIPPESLKNIIDKTATYVIKNGRQFEETLRTKSEERFTFLLPDNEHYAYYMYKITNDPDAASKEQKTRKAAAVAAALMSKKGLSADKISPVSFSIKAKDEHTPTTLHQPALPQENSDDEADDAQHKPLTGDAQPRSVPEHVQKAIQLVESQLMARNAQLAAVVVAVTTPSLLPTLTTTAITATTVTNAAGNTRSRFDIDYNAMVATTVTTASVAATSKTHVKSTKAELERNALYEQQQQHRQKELRKAEEKVKDKLAQIAREKLGGLISKEKQLQLERKRKALAFLNQIKGPPAANSEQHVNDDEKEKHVDVHDNADASDDSDISVHSIPITSFGPDDDKSDEETNVTALQTNTTATPKVHDNEPPALKINAIMVSDDDDVQLVCETKPPKLRHHRVKSKHQKGHDYDYDYDDDIVDVQPPSKRKRRAPSSESTAGSCVYNDINDVRSREQQEEERRRRHSKTRKHHKSASKVKKLSKHHHSKKKSKKSSRSRSQTRSPTLSRSERSRQRSKSHRHSRSHTRASSSCSGATVESVASQQRKHEKRSKDHRKRESRTPEQRHKEKHRKHAR